MLSRNHFNHCDFQNARSIWTQHFWLKSALCTLPHKFILNKAKSKSSLRPRSYTKFKDYIEIDLTDIFQKAH